MNLQATLNPVLPRVGIYARPHQPHLTGPLTHIITHLTQQGIDWCLEAQSATLLPTPPKGSTRLPANELAEHCDVLLVIGGDGSLLSAAQIALQQQLPVIGINRGRLGFLTDIHPHALDELTQVLRGHYHEEHRFLLQVHWQTGTGAPAQAIALNEAVVLRTDLARMIEFQLSIDQHFVCQHRADGLIAATPTGSTAYALSGGGPIVHPALDAISLLPMFPHTLSSRPIVVPGAAQITLEFDTANVTDSQISCDGHPGSTLAAGHPIRIEKYPYPLRLLHPLSYDYYETLRSKLNWAHPQGARP